jgi:hypothetical protein
MGAVLVLGDAPASAVLGRMNSRLRGNNGPKSAFADCMRSRAHDIRPVARACHPEAQAHRTLPYDNLRAPKDLAAGASTLGRGSGHTVEASALRPAVESAAGTSRSPPSRTARVLQCTRPAEAQFRSPPPLRSGGRGAGGRGLPEACTGADRTAIEFSPLRMRSMRGGAGGGATRGMHRRPSKRPTIPHPRRDRGPRIRAAAAPKLQGAPGKILRPAKDVLGAGLTRLGLWMTDGWLPTPAQFARGPLRPVACDVPVPRRMTETLTGGADAGS